MNPADLDALVQLLRGPTALLGPQRLGAATVSCVCPNAAHHALASLEARGALIVAVGDGPFV